MKMKIEFDLSDLKDIYCDTSEHLYETVSVNNIKKAVMEAAVDNFTHKLHLEFCDRDSYLTIENEVKAIVRENKEKIIDRAIERIAESVLKRKEIVNQMPKKSELNSINKEWESYFIELIDKAIKRKFS